MFYKVVTYGCQMNVHESEKIAGLLEKMGYEGAGEEFAPDVLVYNTCCIRDTAERRALGNIGVAKADKKRNPDMIIAVCGCMTQQPGGADVLKEKYPYVDIVLGTRNLDILPFEIQKVIERRENKRKNDKKYRCFDVAQPENYLELDEKIPQYRTSFPNAWVNIIYGCNNFCSYCIVPYVRGREISRNEGNILDEVKSLVDEGYKEITLLGQNVNSYGHDLSNGESFARLLENIDKIDGKFRVRFMTSHPKDLSDEVIDVMAQSQKICNNLHLPIQSGSSKVLKEMNRRYDRDKYLSLIEKLRAKMPDIGITTDIMVGFPTETEQDFEDTMDIVRQVRYSNAFTFIYSPRKGTPAAAMPQIPYEIKKRRIGELIKLQNSITKELSKDYIGNVYEILTEDISPKNDGFVCGRTESGRLVTYNGTKEDIGKFQKVLIEESRSASLFGHTTDK
ncbi:MAG: tRNA (N6-isopentenyl adenosine(37)-C2)-methylthiotransferase MiaB [Clostridia bacterium]|nr:tRNA (N6-isopentenyl adenosine(37)-C2)-methylthiotransferase MiaB [Clostridia bacterium]